MLTIISKILEVLGLTSNVVAILSALFELLGELAVVITLFKLFSRLGCGLMWRQIQVIGDSDAFNKLETVLLDTGLFREKNITHVDLDNIEKVDEAKLAIVNYGSIDDDKLRKILERLPSRAELIVYCDPKDGKLNQEMMSLLSDKSHVVLTNFRGRLANDILTSLMVLSYDRRNK